MKPFPFLALFLRTEKTNLRAETGLGFSISTICFTWSQFSPTKQRSQRQTINTNPHFSPVFPQMSSSSMPTPLAWSSPKTGPKPDTNSHQFTITTLSNQRLIKKSTPEPNYQRSQLYKNSDSPSDLLSPTSSLPPIEPWLTKQKTRKTQENQGKSIHRTEIQSNTEISTKWWLATQNRKKNEIKKRWDWSIDPKMMQIGEWESRKRTHLTYAGEFGRLGIRQTDHCWSKRHRFGRWLDPFQFVLCAESTFWGSLLFYSSLRNDDSTVYSTARNVQVRPPLPDSGGLQSDYVISRWCQTNPENLAYWN